MPNSGVLLIDKPTEMTSHDLVNIARKVFQTKKIGHNGTLDPDATGVMVLCVGQATRLNEYFTADDKRYRATLRFGTETDTQDSSGNVVATCALPTMDEAGFRDVLTRFVGKQEQTPPLYSAIKKDGKPLYRYAREGVAVDDIPKREIEIYALECLSYNNEEAVIDVHCSKGTYIRTLCQDIARACGSCGCMSALRRTAAGAFTLDALPQRRGAARERRSLCAAPADERSADLAAVGDHQRSSARRSDERSPRACCTRCKLQCCGRLGAGCAGWRALGHRSHRSRRIYS